MALRIARLRFWFALGAVLVTATAAGAYFYARWRVQNALQQAPGKLNIEIQQSAQGFTVSRSEGGRTLFKIQANKVVQYKTGGRAELHNVSILLYGRDSNRYDQIYGDDFEYDPRSGDVVANGEVQIDLEANPAGILNPDQAVPRELKNPVHLRTSGLKFNQKTGDASTREKVEFSIPQARGSAIGVSYSSKSNVLTLESKVNIAFNGALPMSLTAVRATITKDPRVVTLEKVELQGPTQRSQADRTTLFLRSDNTVERILASGNLNVETLGHQPAHMQAQQLIVWTNDHEETLRSALFSGNVRVDTAGDEVMQGSAGKVLMNFSGKNQLVAARMEENAKLSQRQKTSANAQIVEITAPQLDFVVAGGHLKRAETNGPPQIVVRSEAPGAGQTLVSAGKFEAQFSNLGKLASVHGSPDARIVNSSPQQPDRVSVSDTLDAVYVPGKGMESILQQGHVAYTDGDRKAWAERARYTPADQTIVLMGSPRVVEGGMTTTARSMRLNRATGDAFAEGDVKSTYSDLKVQPDGALLASSDPIHVTARSMTAHRSSAIALYSGNARLWQKANIVEAPTIEFDRNRRSITARSAASQNVSTVLMLSGKNDKVLPVTISAASLIYVDQDRKVHFEGNVVAKSADFTLSAGQMDVFLHSRGPEVAQDSLAGAGKIERIVAQTNVVITQPTRRAVGEQLVYTAAEDKFVLTGGPPSIFDAERGKITGVSLTFFRHDDRVLVEGNDTSPTVTHTRVAR